MTFVMAGLVGQRKAIAGLALAPPPAPCRWGRTTLITTVSPEMVAGSVSRSRSAPTLRRWLGTGPAERLRVRAACARRVVEGRTGAGAGTPTGRNSAMPAALAVVSMTVILICASSVWAGGLVG